MQEQSLAVRLAKTCPEARELLQLHRRCFRRFWQWNDDVVLYAKLYGKIWTTYGWELNTTVNSKIQTLRNFLMQANASERLRIACYRFVARGGPQRGFLLAGPVHDALLVETATESIEDAIHFTRSVMEEASRAVLAGFTLGVDIKVWRHPDRFMDEKRGRATWNKIMDYLDRAEADANRPHFHNPLRLDSPTPPYFPYYISNTYSQGLS
jgi:DNA polymerase-1